MLNLRFGGAVVYVAVSTLCAECNLFEIRGSIFHVGDPNYGYGSHAGVILSQGESFIPSVK